MKLKRKFDIGASFGINLSIWIWKNFYVEMRLKLLWFFTVTGCCLFLSVELFAQNCVLTGLNNTSISSSCSQVCRDLTFQIPDIRASSTYTVVNIPYNPYPYVTAGGTEDFKLYNDDKYSAVFNLPFPFCFYDSVYTTAVVSSNGLVTFDTSYAHCFNAGAAWNIVSTIPYNGGGFLSCTPDDYPPASIMAAFMDIDPRPGPSDPTLSSPVDRKIEWRVEGTAPCRRFVVSYYHIGAYQLTSCGQNPDSAATFQIVMYESTGLIDIFFQNKSCTAVSSNGTKAILGVQNFSRTKAVAAPGKNATTWTASNEGYRFVPTGGVSRYVSSELLAMNLSHIAWANSSNSTQGLLDLTFPDICSPATSTQYIVRTIFSACDNPATQLISMDTITINLTGSLNATATTTNTACGPPSGTITVDVPVSAISPFRYVLDGGAPVVGPAFTHTFTNVAQGPHTVIVTDGNNACNSTINITVNQNNTLTATVTTTAASCAPSSNGTITVTPSNGSAPYAFSLDGGAPQAGPAPFTFINVAAGPHNIIVTDAFNCVTNSNPVTVAASPVLTTTTNKTDVLCSGGSTGTITVTQPATGTGPYQYSLDGITWQSSNTFNGLVAGTYTVYYRESNGCQGSQPVTVNEPAMLAATASSVPVVCNGQRNGTITITTNGGIPPYQYSIDGGATWQTSNVFNVAAGTYTITVRDNNNCTTTQSATVTEPIDLTASSLNTNANCDGGNNGIIAVIANGGNPGYQYSLNGTTFQASNIFNTGPGNYTVTVKDNPGCITTFNSTVGLNNNLRLTPQTDPTICEGTSVQLQLNSNATQFAWTPSTALSNPGISNPVVNPAVTTQYIVTATLGRCSTNDTVVVNVNRAPVPDAGTAGFICYGQSYRLQGSGGTRFNWAPSTYLNSTNISNPVSTPAKTITYTLSVVDDNGCHSLVTDDLIVDVRPPIQVTTLPNDTTGYAGDKFQLNANSGANIYTWSPSIGLSDPNVPNPVVTVGVAGDDVVYHVTASTGAGCKGEGSVRIKVYNGPDIYVPTGFTPNNDGKNDKFTPLPVGIKKINYFRVFDRWGQMVFSSTTFNEGWDGKLGGREQPSSIYVWMVQGITKDDKVITKKGTVMLIR